MRSVLTISVFSVLLFLNFGCATSRVKDPRLESEPRFVRGELRRVLTSPSSLVEAAINDSIDRLDMDRVNRDADKLSGRYKLRTGDDRSVLVRYERIDRQSTLIRIRVGSFGDRDLSNALLLEIQNQLGDGYGISNGIRAY